MYFHGMFHSGKVAANFLSLTIHTHKSLMVVHLCNNGLVLMVFPGMKEARQNRVYIPDVPSHQFYKLVQCLYGDQTPPQDEQEAITMIADAGMNEHESFTLSSSSLIMNS
jgi:hypothetical protein